MNASPRGPKGRNSRARNIEGVVPRLRGAKRQAPGGCGSSAPLGFLRLFPMGPPGGPIASMPDELELPQARARAAPARNHSIDQKQNDRTHDRGEPGRDVE